MPAIVPIQTRNGTAEQWTAANPILLKGEQGIETDTNKVKYGDGVTAWSSLPYAGGSTGTVTSVGVTAPSAFLTVSNSPITTSGSIGLAFATNPTIPVNLFVGSQANTTRFPNALSVVSSTASGIQQNESHNIGLIAEGVANPSNTSIYGVGLYGVGYTSGATRSGGVVGEGHVSASTDTGSAIGVRGYSNDTHASGLNIGLYGDATGGSSSYSLYLNNGGIYNNYALTWTMNNNIVFSGAYSVTIPTLKFGDGTTQTTAATSYTLPTASTSVIGGVKVDGTSITINGSGVISGASTYTLPTASTTVLGGVKVDGTSITINGSGVISSTGGGGGSGTVTSVGMTVPSFLSVSGSPITTSGTLAVTLSGTALPIVNGGTGTTSTTYCSLTSNVSGTLPIANGGTGATTLSGANIAVTNVNNTFTGTNTLNGSTSSLAAVLVNAAETTTVSATAATGTINIDFSTQSVLYYTSNASANWIVNFRHSSGTTLNTAMAIGQTVTMTFMVTNGATAYYNTSVQVDGTTTGVTTKWQGGTAPTSGDASSVDVYTYAIIKTAASTFTVLAAVSKFA